MNYHPIDKPTQPGWYWLENDEGLVNPYKVVDGSVMLSSGKWIPLGSVNDFSSKTWYGPRIEEPTGITRAACEDAG